MITVDNSEGVAVLTLNRPKAHNTIDLELASGLADAIADLAHTRELRCVLLRADGPDFCPGGDLRSFGGDPEMGRHLRRVTGAFHMAVARLVRLPVPVVAAVQGNAFGGGLALALAADLVIVADDARMGMAYTAAGLSPDGGSTWILPRLVGLRRALELTLLNRRLSAVEAVEWGLVTTVVPAHELQKNARALADRLAQGPTLALGASKALLWTSGTSTHETQLEAEAQTMSRIADGRDAKAGVAAFLDRTVPAYSGLG